MSVLELVPIILLGAVCGLDSVSFAQIMISRPIVAATAAGALAGHAGEGLLIGAVLELIALDTRPFGASRYPEWGTASVVGGALFVEQSPQAGALPLAVFAALGSAMVSGTSMVALRQFNGRLTARLLGEVERGSRAAVTRLQLTGLTADVIRAGAITVGLFLLFRPILAAGVQVWGAEGVLSTALVVAIAAAVAGGVVWNALPAGSQRLRVALIVGGVTAAILVG